MNDSYANHKDEYDFLTRHYFYEGELMLKRNQFFIALNLGFFTIMGFLINDGNSLTFTSPLLLALLCTLGAFISLMWISMTLRASWYIESRVRRVKELEENDLDYKIMRYLAPSNKWYAKPYTATWRLFIYLGSIFAVAWIGFAIIFLLN